MRVEIMKNLSTGLAMLLLFAILSALPVHAAIGNLYAEGITAPKGMVWMGSHLWVSDQTQGFCRLDAPPLSEDFSINPATCSKVAIMPGQPSFDGTFVYVPDSATTSRGVWRLTFNPATETVESAVLLAPKAGLGKLRPTSTALREGKLYIGFLKTNDINRIPEPGANPALQNVDKFGKSIKVGVHGLTFAGTNLYLAESDAVTRIGQAGGDAVSTPIMVQAPTAIASDGINVLFIAETPTTDSAILRYTIDTNMQEIFATTGSEHGLIVPLRFARGLALNKEGKLFIGDDATDGARVMEGHIFKINTGLSPQLPGAPPPALKQGTLYASGITDPEGVVWMGSHLWVSDHTQGFCRLDSRPEGGFAINPNTCNIAAKEPAQPTFDASMNLVYVPDNSGQSKGIWRLTFDPVTETVGNALLLAPNAGLGGRRPVATALGTDGKLYVGFSKSGDIVRITNPGGDPLLQKEEKFGKTSDGRTVYGFAFIGSDLYVAEQTAVTKIVGGIAVSTAITATVPTAITSDGSNWLFVADTPVENSNILRYSASTNIQDIYANEGMLQDGTTAPFKFVSGLALDPMGTLFVSDDLTNGATAMQGRIWNVASAFEEYRETGVIILKPPREPPIDKEKPEKPEVEPVDVVLLLGMLGVVVVVLVLYLRKK